MSKFPPMMSFRWIFQLLNSLWLFLSYLFNKQVRKVLQYQPVKYDLYPLSPVSRHRLSLVKRKILVLDLDESVRIIKILYYYPFNCSLPQLFIFFSSYILTMMVFREILLKEFPMISQ